MQRRKRKISKDENDSTTFYIQNENTGALAAASLYLRGGGIDSVITSYGINSGKKLTFNVDAGGTGPWNNDSHSSYKEYFRDVDVLEKVKALNIKEWQYSKYCTQHVTIPAI